MNDQSEPQNQNNQQPHPLNREVHPHISKAVLALMIMVGIGGTALTVSSLGQSQDNRSRASEGTETHLPGDLLPDKIIQTGVRIIFERSSRNLYTTVVVQDANTTQELKKIPLAKGGKYYNLALDPGIYTITLQSDNVSVAPIPPSTVVVEQGKLAKISIQASLPHEHVDKQSYEKQ